jgi:hypothetical protein
VGSEAVRGKRSPPYVLCAMCSVGHPARPVFASSMGPAAPLLLVACCLLNGLLRLAVGLTPQEGRKKSQTPPSSAPQA